MNVTPLLRCKGTVHARQDRTVDAVDARPAERDPETGRVVREPMDAREAYDVLDLTVLTDQGGFCPVVLRMDDAVGGVLAGDLSRFERGQTVDLPVRPYIYWAGRPGSKYATVRFSVASDAFISESTAAKSPRLAATGS